MTPDSLPTSARIVTIRVSRFALGYGRNGMTFGSWRRGCFWSNGKVRSFRDHAFFEF